MIDFGTVVSLENSYVVFAVIGDTSQGYGVVPKSEDPECKFDYDEVFEYCTLYPDKVITREQWEADTRALDVRKKDKHTENVAKATSAIEKGYVTYNDAEFETNVQTVSDMTSTLILMEQTGLETYSWVTRDDKVVTLTKNDFKEIGILISEFKNEVWGVKYIDYKTRIDNATTGEELDEIIIIY